MCIISLDQFLSEFELIEIDQESTEPDNVIDADENSNLTVSRVEGVGRETRKRDSFILKSPGIFTVCRC